MIPTNKSCSAGSISQPKFSGSFMGTPSKTKFTFQTGFSVMPSGPASLLQRHNMRMENPDDRTQSHEIEFDEMELAESRVVDRTIRMSGAQRCAPTHLMIRMEPHR